jgi:hypothetical protein
MPCSWAACANTGYGVRRIDVVDAAALILST